MIKDSNLPNKQEHPKSCPRTTKDWTKAGHYLVEEVTVIKDSNLPNKQEHPKSCPRTTKDWTKAGHYLVEEVTRSQELPKDYQGLD